MEHHRLLILNQRCSRNLGSKRKGSGLEILSVLKSECCGLSRKFDSPGTSALGTRRASDVPAAAHRSPIAWTSAGAGSSLQFLGRFDRSTSSTIEVSKA